MQGSKWCLNIYIYIYIREKLIMSQKRYLNNFLLAINAILEKKKKKGENLTNE